MDFASTLIPGRLVRRYKRFFADVALEDGRSVTAHVPNTGSLMGLSTPGLRVWLEPASNPKRKLPFTWRVVELRPGGRDEPKPSATFVGIDTGMPNRVVGEALAQRRVPGLEAYGAIAPERRYRGHSRVDFLLSAPDLPDVYLEVKNVHLLRRPGLIEFPDSVTARGVKHLGDLAAMVAEGHRAVLLYCVQRGDGTRLAVARDLDPAYADAFAAARAAGVEALAMACRVSPHGIALDRPLPISET
ncbi:MAG: DNA/RNA nuclease SfsA [Pseudomonadota bacterium]